MNNRIRVYELAKMLGKSNKDLMKVLQDLGVEVKTHMSSIDGEIAQLVEDALASPVGGSKPEAGVGGDGRRTVENGERATIKAVAEKMGGSSGEAE